MAIASNLRAIVNYFVLDERHNGILTSMGMITVVLN